MRIIAQKFQKICMNGHQLSVTSNRSFDPDEFCPKCGASVISTCQSCHVPIEGWYESEGFAYIGPRNAEKPYYCKKCAAPYPWTEQILNNATELIALDDNLSDEDKQLIKTAIPDLLVDTPKTQLAEAKFKKVFPKVSTFVKDSMYNLLVDVLSETAKKSLFPD
ncbi:DUF2321 domain-containing protein [Listeria monocytogenes]|uniref:DUF2321 domain-containing protein n=1 Tax=Listeria monocytogenes TaxID=1639 RepID=UPI00223815B9|nr:DUF2321 domain-containing protein [Listeria monocytogenes]